MSAMAKGRGRGRGRPKLQPLATFVSSVITRNQPSMEKSTQEITTPPSVPIANPAKNGGTACEIGSSSTNTGISKRLDLNTLVTIGQLATSPPVPENGTIDLVNQAQNQVSIQGNSEKSTVEEAAMANKTTRPKASWTTLFQKNRCATNGMSLSYILPQIVDGQPMVQLDELEVEEEEKIWKCVLIAYIIGDGPR